MPINEKSLNVSKPRNKRKTAAISRKIPGPRKKKRSNTTQVNSRNPRVTCRQYQCRISTMTGYLAKIRSGLKTTKSTERNSLRSAASLVSRSELK